MRVQPIEAQTQEWSLQFHHRVRSHAIYVYKQDCCVLPSFSFFSHSACSPPSSQHSSSSKRTRSKTRIIMIHIHVGFICLMLASPLLAEAAIRFAIGGWTFTEPDCFDETDPVWQIVNPLPKVLYIDCLRALEQSRTNPEALSQTPAGMGYFRSLRTYESGSCGITVAVATPYRGWTNDVMYAAIRMAVEGMLYECLREQDMAGARLGMGGMANVRSSDHGGLVISITIMRVLF